MAIPTKEQLVQDLKESFQATINWINEQPESHFNKEMIEGKWTIAGHLYHLIKSTKGVSKGLVMPKLALRTMFGKNKRMERTYQEMVEKYTNTIIENNVKTTSDFEVKKGRVFERSELINRFEGELNDFVKALEKWKEKDMSIYVMPHPVLGKLTIREFVYFTILHTHHHLDNLKTNYVKVA